MYHCLVSAQPLKHSLKADYQHFLSYLFISDNVKCSFIFKYIMELKLYHCCATNCYLHICILFLQRGWKVLMQQSQTKCGFGHYYKILFTKHTGETFPVQCADSVKSLTDRA